MTIKKIICERAITEVVHFTPHSGLLGVLHSGHILSRKRLPSSVELEHIYKPNASYRKDVAWLDYVNLSISSINHQFFDSSCRWHPESELWWCILSLDPVVLEHDGVVFTTTNNMYSGVHRGEGPEGIQELFKPSVELWQGNDKVRLPGHPTKYTTCPQAEALYPEAVSITHLKRVYVTCHEHADEVHAQLGLTGNAHVEVIVDPDRFRMTKGNRQ